MNIVLSLLNKYAVDFTKLRYKLSKDEVLEIQELTSFLNADSSINERLFCLNNNLLSSNKCAFCKIKKTVFISLSKGYQKYCCHECSALDKKGLKPTEEAIQKRKDTLLQKYGVTHNFQKGSELYDKKQITIREKYGVTNVSSNADIQRKKQQNIRNQNNGEHFSKSDEYKKQRNESYKNKNGVDLVHCSIIKQNRRISRLQTTFNKWVKIWNNHGFKSLTPLPDFKGRVSYNLQFERVDCGQVFWYKTSSSAPIDSLPRCPKCHGRFKAETELQQLLSGLDIEYQTNIKTIIPPYQLDLYIPKFNLAIEFNGLYWHSDIHPRITQHYHNDKTNSCNSKNIQLFHIFENEWVCPIKREIWKSIIKNRLHNNNETIYARKCELKIISSNEAKLFFEHNHLQGSSISQYAYGLFYDDILVSCMTFSVSRYNKEYQYELMRFATLMGYNIVGGASKLFTAFIRDIKPLSVITYADRRRSNAITTVYERMGFTYLYNSEPSGHYWHKNNPSRLINRVTLQKHKLSKILFDFDPNLTGYENLTNNGYYRIWDCGNQVYVWKS